ncbi:MAG: hypothetical protein KBH23_04730 [Bacteroidaceae bacterium]|nr:hypothetical protein [Bacteroidaceae bacterium]
MNSKIKFPVLLMALFCFSLFPELAAKNLEVKQSLEGNVVCSEAVDLHLTSATMAMMSGATINLASEEAWLFFDNLKPSLVLKNYKSAIFINGKAFDPTSNARIAIYKQGTVIIPHAVDFQPLETFTEKNFEGSVANYSIEKYYSNSPSDSVPRSLLLPLEQDNKIHSLKLKRGYMATLANNPDGMGYSRVFIADKEDLELSELPDLLDGKVSFIRVFKWQYVSKKGWVGSVDSGQPDGLKYVEEQCDKTNSTWYYNWSGSVSWSHNPNTTAPNYDQEFSPEKWGAGGRWSEFFSIANSSHLLGYNEPDHSEQSNVTVDKAIEEWPLMLQTGMRVGSPATTDFTWLYNFMSACNKKNYRVDYVAIHAYWGGLSASEWYTKLKAIHDQTGRPIWITEWNNGANWTNESWPSGTTAQQAKQLSDIKGILNVLDTTQFVERYSLYNWVEDKRKLIMDGELTPAGEYYANDTSNFAFNRISEVVPSWTVREAPVLSYNNYSDEKGITLSWSDYNGELISQYIIERGINTSTFTPIDTLEVIANQYTDLLNSEVRGTIYYRVKSIDLSGKLKISNTVKYDCLQNSKDDFTAGKFLITENWALATWANPYSKDPVFVLGTPTYRNKMPLSYRVRNLSEASFDFKLDSWEYEENPTFVNPDTIAYIVLPEGIHSLGGITAQAASLSNVNQSWTKISFATPFDVIPVIFATQITDNSEYATSVRVRNVTKTDFEIALQYEGELEPTVVSEQVSYVAMTPGTGTYNGQSIKVGRTGEAAVGDYLSGGYTINFGDTYKESLFYGFMQTESDNITSTLRIKRRGDTSVDIFKDREKSVSTTQVTPETVGWMVIGSLNGTGITEVSGENNEVFFNQAASKVSLLNGESICHADVYSLLGQKVMCQRNIPELDVTNIEPGMYIVVINKKQTLKIVKR